MRYILSMLILLFSLSFFTIACGGDDTTDGNSCSPACSSNETCKDGKCVPNTCTPDCSGKTCGDNGCGGSCGTCNTGETCNAAGTCETETCTPKTCADLAKECGTFNDGCGTNLECGTCDTGKYCNAGTCEVGTCTPDCSGKNCGDDGCSGSCGTCNTGETCNAAGTCEVDICTPKTCADLAKECGFANDGCGNNLNCGNCGTGEICNAGTCEVDTCTPKTCGDLGRECGTVGDGCGTDLDCGDCGAGEYCSNVGVCETGTCTPKTCGDLNRECGTVGDGCGTDLDCGDCGVGEACSLTGTCEADTCVPNCIGKVCGADGCGGSCGTCNNGETCNAAGTCDTTTTGGDLGGECSAESPCNDNTNLCLGPQDGSAPSHCYEACNGVNDSCSQTNYTCQDTQNQQVGWICLPDTVGSTPVGGDCSAEACVATAVCLDPNAPTCYEKCTNSSSSCTISGYTCQDTGNADIGWVCAPAGAPGTVPIGGTCDSQNGCVDTASCLGPENGPYTCYEMCNGEADTCSITGYTCQAAAGANYCLPSNEPGTAQPGESCDAGNNCVETAMCLSADGGVTNTCYETCTGTTDTCSQTNYECVDTGNANIGWICMEQATPGTAQPGESCDAGNNCVETAMCLSADGGVTNTCYETCTGTTDTCSQTNYGCVDTGNANIGWICMEQAAPGTVPIGGTCDAENNCVAEATCLGPENGPYTCYEICDPNNGGACSQATYTCQAVAGGNYCVPPQ